MFYPFQSLLAFSVEWCLNQCLSSLLPGVCTDSSLTGRRRERFWSPYREGEENCVTETKREWHTQSSDLPYYCLFKNRRSERSIIFCECKSDILCIFAFSLCIFFFFTSSLHLMIKFLDYHPDINKLKESVWYWFKWEWLESKDSNNDVLHTWCKKIVSASEAYFVSCNSVLKYVGEF